MHEHAKDYALWALNTFLLLFRKTLKSSASQIIFIKDTNLIIITQMLNVGLLKIVSNVRRVAGTGWKALYANLWLIHIK